MDFELKKLPKDLQTKVIAAFKNDKKIDSEEAKKLGLSAEEAKTLSDELAGNPELVGDYAQFSKTDKEGNKQTLTLFNGKEEGVLTLNPDTIRFYRGKYPDAKISSAYLKNGVVTLIDSSGKPALDSAGNSITVDFTEHSENNNINLTGFYLSHNNGNFDINKLIELQILENSINSTPKTDENYTELKLRIESEKLDMMSYDERKNYITSKIWNAYNNKDFGAWFDAVTEFYNYECEKIDDKLKIRAAKDFIKDKTHFNNLVDYLDKVIDDKDDKLSTMELLWEVTKGIGDSIDSFIGTQGATMMMGFGAATKAATSVPKIGGILGGAIQAYFGTEGSILIGSGVIDGYTAETKEEARGAGAEIGLGAIMVHGAKSSVSKTVNVLEYKQLRSKILESTSLEELKALQESIASQQYSREQKQALNVECVKQLVKIEELKKANEVLRSETGENPVTPELSASADMVNELPVQTENAESLVDGKFLQTAKKLGLIAEKITNEEANAILKKYGLSDADIEEVRAKNGQTVNNMIKAGEFLTEAKSKEFNLKEMSPENIKKELCDIAEDNDGLYYFCNEKSIKGIQETFNIKDRESAIKFMLESCDLLGEESNYDALFEKLKEVSKLGDVDLLSNLSSNRCISEEDIEACTFKKMKAAKAISDTLGTEFDFYVAQFINNPEFITPEFLAEYKAVFEQCKKLNLEFDPRREDPVKYLEFVKKNIKFMQDTGLDVSWYKSGDKKGGFSITTINNNIAESPNPKAVKQFMDLCSAECKERYPEEIRSAVLYLGFEQPEALARIFNKYTELNIKKDGYREPSPFDFINQKKDYCKDMNDLADLLDWYAENEISFRYDRDDIFVVMNGDYKGAIKLLSAIKDFCENSNSLVQYQQFIEGRWNGIVSKADIDFNTAIEKLQKIKKYNLQEKTGYEVLRDIILAKDKEVVEKIAALVQNDIRLEAYYQRQFTDNPELPAEDFKANLEMIINLLKESGTEEKGTMIANLANSKLTHQEWCDLFAKLGENFPAKDKITLLSTFNARNTYEHSLNKAQLLELTDKMIKLNFSGEQMSYVINGAKTFNYEFFDKLFGDPNTHLLRNNAINIFRVVTNKNNVLADKLCFYRELNFPQEYIAKILEVVKEKHIFFTERLCYDKSFPREHIARISNNINEINAELADILCFDKELNFPKDKIAGIIKNVTEDNKDLAKRLCTYKELGFTPDMISEIVGLVHHERVEFATKICTDKTLEYPKEEIPSLLHNISITNAEYIEKMIRTKDFSPENIVKLAKYAEYKKENLDALEQVTQTTEMRKWADKNLENGNTEVDLVINLARTQKKLFREAEQIREEKEIQARKEAARQLALETAAEEVKADPNALEKITESLVSLGVPEGMAKNAYAKLCVDSKGNLDKIKLDAVGALIKTYGIETTVNAKGKTRININISPKDITDIFKLATGNMNSNANGEFRVQVIKDIIALKEAGIDDIKFASKIAAVKSMDLIEMKSRLGGEERRDLAKRTDGVENIKADLKSKGIDLDAIKEKVLTSDKKIEESKILREPPQEIHRRTLDEIVGSERVILSKFKNEVDTSIWSDESAFKRWAEEKLEHICNWDENPDYTSTKFPHFNDARKEGIQDWLNFLKSDESSVKDDIFAQLLFMDGITKELKPDNASVPPKLSVAVFEEVFNSLLDENQTESVSKAYARINRQKAYEKYGQGEIVSRDGVRGQWIKIPRTEKNSADFNDHVAMIQALAEGSSWCLRGAMAENYIQRGDIHFFMDSNGNAQTAIGVNSKGKIFELQKRYNQDGSAPVPYIEVIDEWRKANNFHGKEEAIDAALKAKPEFDRQKEEFAKMMAEGNVVGIFTELEFEVTEKPDGTLSLKNYRAFVKNYPYTLFDLGIDENALMENVSEIKHFVNLEGSALTSAPKLVSIGIDKIGNVIDFGDNKISDLRSLEQVGRSPIYWEKP